MNICSDCFGAAMACREQREREAADMLRANADALRYAAAIFEAAEKSVLARQIRGEIPR